MPTGADQIFVERTRQALAILGVGATTKAYLETGMDDQGSSLTVNNHVEFDEQRIVDASGRIALSAGAGQLSGLFTLAEGLVFLCVAYVATTHSAAGTATFRWRDNNIATAFGSQGGAFTAAAGNGPRALAWGIIDTSGEAREIELRIDSAPVNLTQIDGSGPQQESSAFILEIG
jgi:hypothetical protein